MRIERRKNMERLKVLLAVLGGALATFARQYVIIIAFVILAITLDVITGLIKAKVTREKINNKKGETGLWKKAGLLAALALGFLLDYFIPYMLAMLSITLPPNALFGMIFGCYIVLNECISICENLYKCNPGILPTWVLNMLTGAKEEIEKKGVSDSEN